MSLGVKIPVDNNLFQFIYGVDVVFVFKQYLSNGNNLLLGALSEQQYFIPGVFFFPPTPTHHYSLYKTRPCAALLIQFIPIQTSNIINGPQMLILIATFD
jgi:hypothetical protein